MPTARPLARSTIHLQHAHVLAEARPEELAALVLAEPVDAEDARRVRDLAAELQPVVEVVGHVVAAERQHRERVAPHLPDRPGGRGRRLRAHRRGQVDAVGPVERLVDQRDRVAAPAAEDERRDRHALRVVPVGVDRRALADRRGEARVRMRRRCVRSPGVQSLPCQSISCAGGSSVMPSHHTSPSSVSATLVKIVFARIDAMAFGFELVRRARARRRRSRPRG